MSRVYSCLPMLDSLPEAIVAPERFISQHPSPSKCETSFWGPFPSTSTDISRTVTSGMKRAGSRVMVLPSEICSRIFPMPVALIEEPPTPLIVQGGIGFRSKKSPVLGEICMMAPESSMNGPKFLESVEREA
jgi:hypothetical protein